MLITEDANAAPLVRTAEEERLQHIACLAVTNWAGALAGEVPRLKKVAARVVATALREIEHVAGPVPAAQRAHLQADLRNVLLRYVIAAGDQAKNDGAELLRRLPGGAEALQKGG